MAEPGKNTQEQFQVGEFVVYTPEGILSEVEGYCWSSSVDRPPVIVGYQLRHVANVISFSDIRRPNSEERTRYAQSKGIF